jgi:CMP/dCMP kinase
VFTDAELRTEAVGSAASIVSAIPGVRAALLGFQRAFAAQMPGAVLDGRDIGTVVCPDAQLKLFITATPEIRAARRLAELTSYGIDTDFDAVLADIRARDTRDRTRAASPLLPAGDAVVMDTSNMPVEAVIASAIKTAESRRRGPGPGQ